MANALISESSISVEKRAEFVGCLSFVLGEIREAALDNSRCPRQVEVAFSGMLFGKNFATSYRLPSVSKKVEFGGVLFGKKGATRVRIIAFRPLMSEHAFGGDATLSEHDRRAIAELILGVRADSDLSELEPLGWFRAHPMSDLRLSKWDTELFNYFFNEPWQIGLVAQPAKSAPTRARLYFRESDGSLHPESYQELVVPTIPGKLLLRLDTKTAPEPVKCAAPAAALPASVSMRHRAPGIPSWTAMATLGIVLALAYWWASPPKGVPLPAPLNHSLAANQEANRQEQAKQRAAALWKKFKEETSRQIQEVEAAAAAAKLREQALTKELQAPPREELARSVRKPSPAVPVQRTSPARTDRNPDSEQQRSTPAHQAQKRTTAPQSAPPPELPSAMPSQLRSWHASVAGKPVPTALAVGPGPPSDAASITPTFGTLIWTGRLHKNGTVTIFNQNASTGSITGRLPAKPVTFTVLPGELIDGGVILYTSNAQRTISMSDPPGPQNSWNRTFYMWNPHRAGDITVVQSPGPQNGWQRLELRSKDPRISVIVVDWTLAR